MATLKNDPSDPEVQMVEVPQESMTVSSNGAVRAIDRLKKKCVLKFVEHKIDDVDLVVWEIGAKDRQEYRNTLAKANPKTAAALEKAKADGADVTVDVDEESTIYDDLVDHQLRLIQLTVREPLLCQITGKHIPGDLFLKDSQDAIAFGEMYEEWMVGLFNAAWDLNQLDGKKADIKTEKN